MFENKLQHRYKLAVDEMHILNIQTVMLSGDKSAVVSKVAQSLGIDNRYGDLFPEGKVEKLHALKNEGKHIAFVGDGINDAPLVSLADAGIAMEVWEVMLQLKRLILLFKMISLQRL